MATQVEMNKDEIPKEREDVDLGQEKVLISWKSLERPFRKRSKDFYSTVMVLGVLVGIIFFFIEGLMPVLLTGAVIFVVFALSRTEPRMVEHSLTNRGVVHAGQTIAWEEMVAFWVEQKAGASLLNFVTTRRWPVQLVLVMPDDPIEAAKIQKTVAEYVEYEEPGETRIDKMVKWVGEKVPLEE